MAARDPPAQCARAAGEVQRRIERHRLAVDAGSTGCGNVGEQDAAVFLADVDTPLDPRRRAASGRRVDEQDGTPRRIDRPQPRGAPSGAVTVRKLLTPACARRSP
jgi:hypothetical protein